MNKLAKIFSVIKRQLIKKIVYVNVDLYMIFYIQYLKKIGIVIEGMPKFISPDTYFDGNDYSKIKIGDNVTISREVMLLTHDYSITTALASINRIIKRHQGELYFSREISIGNNCFIGARVSILPGSKIGNNVIIGACSVVKGNIPDNSIVIGNPYKIISNTDKWATEKEKLKDYKVEL